MRRKKEEHCHVIKVKTRPIHCLKCGRRILDAGNCTKVQLFTLENDRNPDFVVKCGNCGTEIGVIKTE